MASAAEQLAAHMNFGQLGKATELKKRLWFTLGALIIYRLGTYIRFRDRSPDSAGNFQGQAAACWRSSICSPVAPLAA